MPSKHPPPLPPHKQVVSYRGPAEAREAVWERQMGRGRRGCAGGAHVVLTTYEHLMGKHDK